MVAGARRRGQPRLRRSLTDKEVFGEKVAVPSVVGKSEADARKRSSTTPGSRRRSLPTQVRVARCPAGTVASQNPSGTATRGSVITLTLSNGQPPAAADPTRPSPGPARAAGQRRRRRWRRRRRRRRRQGQALMAVRRRPSVARTAGGTRSRRCGRARVRLAGRGALVHAAEVTVPVLPAGQDPLRILHISDLHLTPGQRKQGRLGTRPGLAGPAPRRRHGRQLGAPRRDAGPAARPWSRTSAVPGAFVLGLQRLRRARRPRTRRGTCCPTPARGPREAAAELPWRELTSRFRSAGWIDLTNRRDVLKVDGRVLSLVGTDDAHLDRDRFPDGGRRRRRPHRLRRRSTCTSASRTRPTGGSSTRCTPTTSTWRSPGTRTAASWPCRSGAPW